VVIAPWPTPEPAWQDDAAEADTAALQRVVTEIRRFRADQGIKPGVRVPARLSTPGGAPGGAATGRDGDAAGRDGDAAGPGDAAGRDGDAAGPGDVAGREGSAAGGPGGVTGPLAAFVPQLRALARLELPGDGFTPDVTVPVADLLVELDTSGAIDVAAELARLTKDRAAAEKEQAQAEAKLANPAFLANAPAAVVDTLRARLATATTDLTRIATQLPALHRR